MNYTISSGFINRYLKKSKKSAPLPIGIKFGFLRCGMIDNNGFAETLCLNISDYTVNTFLR